MAFSFDPFVGIEALYKKRKKAFEDGADDFDKALAKSIARLSEAYRNGRHPKLTDEFDRLAYVIQYAPIGIVAVRRLITRLRTRPVPPQLSVLNDEPLAVASIGAGPGNDLFGLLMALAVPPAGIKFLRVDTDTKWKSYYEMLRDDFAEQVKPMADIVNGMETTFAKVDLSEDSLSSSPAADPLAQAEIVILNRVLSGFQSEVYFAHDLIREISRICRKDTLIVIIDVSLPRQRFLEAIALAEGVCRLEKRASERITTFGQIEESHFGWTIPKSIMGLEKYGHKIMRSGRFFGGIVWLKE